MRHIIGYTLTVRAGRLAGTSREYGPKAGQRARRFADRLDNEYGAICASVSPIFSADITAASVAGEHAAEVSAIMAQAAMAADPARKRRGMSCAL